MLEQVGSATLADNVEVAVADGAKLTLVTVADWAVRRGAGAAPQGAGSAATRGSCTCR